MTIKIKISFYISIIFTILFGIICLLVISVFSNFRKQEFKERLSQKALTSILLLIDVQEVDNNLLKIIDQHTINKLYDEKTLIFDQDYNLIYSSLDDTKITWSVSDLHLLKKKNSFFKKDGNYEVYGVFYDGNEEDYYALISANDVMGKRKSTFLLYLLVGAYLLFTVITWILTFFVVKREVMPISFLHQQISTINEFNLDSQLEVNPNSTNEIDLISTEFNFMMNRLNEAYDRQKDFTAQASHELRTPLARISAQLENQVQASDGATKEFLLKVFKDINQLNELINSLLILSKIDNKQHSKTEKIRVDEVIYTSIEKVKRQFQNFKINFEISSVDDLEKLLEVDGNQHLLEIVFTNLLKNAYLYSDNQLVNIIISTVDSRTIVAISNSGKALTVEEQKNIFQPFMRGKNAKGHNGLGLGLRIVHRILKEFGFKISYEAAANKNTFIVHF